MMRLIALVFNKIATHAALYIVAIAVLALGHIKIPQLLNSYKENEAALLRIQAAIATAPTRFRNAKNELAPYFVIPSTSEAISKKLIEARAHENSRERDQAELRRNHSFLYTVPGSEYWILDKTVEFELELLRSTIKALTEAQEGAKSAETEMRRFISNRDELVALKKEKAAELIKASAFINSQIKYRDFYDYCRNMPVKIEAYNKEISHLKKTRPKRSKIPGTASNRRIDELTEKKAELLKYKEENDCTSRISALDSTVRDRSRLENDIANIDVDISHLSKPQEFDGQHILIDFSNADKYDKDFQDLLREHFAILKHEHEKNWISISQTTFEKYKLDALYIVIAGLIAPLFSSVLSYFGLAKLISNRFPIVVESKAPTPTNTKSGIRNDIVSAEHSQGIVLEIQMKAGDVLTVRPEFIGSTPESFEKSFAWIFDVRRPLMCFTAHLINMARVSAREENMVVLRAAETEHLHLASVSIPSGQALVVRPRSVIGVFAKEGVPISVRSVWRLLSIECWLRLQVRFILIDGPANIIVKGHNGVRVEASSKSRAIPQSSTLAYSAHSNYSLTRADTFGGFLSGATSLFKDRFEGDGVVVYEVTPTVTKSRMSPTRFIQDVADALLRAVGI
jgi:hypothetical protein